MPCHADPALPAPLLLRHPGPATLHRHGGHEVPGPGARHWGQEVPGAPPQVQGGLAQLQLHGEIRPHSSCSWEGGHTDGVEDRVGEELVDDGGVGDGVVLGAPGVPEDGVAVVEAVEVSDCRVGRGHHQVVGVARDPGQLGGLVGRLDWAAPSVMG